jgi:hypothetical protein
MIIGLAGPASSGKDTVCARLRTWHGFRVASIAERPKLFVGDAFGFTHNQLFGPSSARSEPHPTVRRADGEALTVRYAMQKLADWARDCSPDVWIERVLRDVSDCEDVAISDVRYANEVAAIRARGGRIIRRKHPGAVFDPHPSESELANMPDSAFDACIGRMDTLDHLYFAVDSIVDGWRSELGR